MIPPGHEHLLRPYAVNARGSGREVLSRCVCDLDTSNGTARTVLEQRLTVDAAGRVTAIAYRFGGLWFSALDLLRVADGLGVEECDRCHGQPPEVAGLGPCSRCGGLGVVADGDRVEPPALAAP